MALIVAWVVVGKNVFADNKNACQENNLGLNLILNNLSQVIGLVSNFGKSQHVETSWAIYGLVRRCGYLVKIFKVTEFIPDQSNRLFQLAVELINQSNRNIFITGKAGTGKTTFLKFIRENCPKQMAVVAPTGVAAINAGGVTIHSFFQLPLSLFVPASAGFVEKEDVINKHSLLSRLRMNTDKRKLLQELELLVIGEISMVRCDTLDAIDTVLRQVRHRPQELFGGVQVIFIGDLFQLPPVVKDEEWNILSDYYASPFFFSSQVLREQVPAYIEFEKIYRQTDEKFISLLNQVRNNKLDQDGYDILERRFNPSFSSGGDEGYIILTTHNSKADAINNSELKKLNEKEAVFKATIEGEFPEKSYPAEENLVLKKGCHVIFIKNDLEKVKRYYNGKIGVVVDFREASIIVQCKGEADTIEVKKDKWENVRYSVDKATRRMETNFIGSFTQYPLRLAWAITIHKSQGLTFEKAIIDAGAAFSPGQVYVALSRCTSLDGIVLRSRISNHSLSSDNRIVEFTRQATASTDLEAELRVSARVYQQSNFLQVFDFTTIVAAVGELAEYLQENRESFNAVTQDWIAQLKKMSQSQQVIAEKFKSQLLRLFESPVPLEENDLLQQRIAAAAKHFAGEFGSIVQALARSPVVTDSRLNAKEFNDAVRDLFSQVSFKIHLFNGCNGRITWEAYQQRKRKFSVPAFTVNAYAVGSSEQEEVAHPLLQAQLRKLRDSICGQSDLPVYMVAGSSTLNDMANYLPHSLEELRRINGFGDAKIKKYGQQFLDIVLAYCAEAKLSSRMHLLESKKAGKKESRKRKTDTKNESFLLYREGMEIAEIAKRRNLAVSTIEGHLAHFVERGDIKIDELVSREKLVIIEPVLKDRQTKSITLVKEKTGAGITYADIRFAIAWQEYENNRDAEIN